MSDTDGPTFGAGWGVDDSEAAALAASEARKKQLRAMNPTIGPAWGDLGARGQRAVQGDGGASGGGEEIDPHTGMPAAPAYTVDELDLGIFDPGPDADRGVLGRKELSRLSTAELAASWSREQDLLLEKSTGEALEPADFTELLSIHAEALRRNSQVDGFGGNRKGSFDVAAEDSVHYQKLAAGNQWDRLSNLAVALEAVIGTICLNHPNVADMPRSQKIFLALMPILLVEAEFASRFRPSSR